jgi:hypothetical protein
MKLLDFLVFIVYVLAALIWFHALENPPNLRNRIMASEEAERAKRNEGK